ncbi:MAG: hypothetical protein J6B09_07340, partial [Clostridia bacterium]|nr:hypothetical protein [Clostridia bacterium]
PDDPDSFIEAPADGAGDQDPEVYGVYEALCDTLASATVYTMDLYMNDLPYLVYETDGEGQYAAMYEEDAFYEVWSVNGQGYKCQDEGEVTQIEIDEGVLQAFETMQMMVLVISDPISGDLMTDLVLTEEEDGLVLTFTAGYEDVTNYYTIAFDAQMTSVYFCICTATDTEVDTVVEYFLDHIGDTDFTVEVPGV